MSTVAGIDVSTRNLDIALIDADTREAAWHRVPLPGRDAWERTLSVRDAIPGATWWDDQAVAHVAIEAPYGRGQPGTNALLNRVVGAVVTSLPAHLRRPERCWIVRPDEVRTGLGLAHNAKATALELGEHGYTGFDHLNLEATLHLPTPQDARDAWALAHWTLTQLDKQAAA